MYVYAYLSACCSSETKTYCEINSVCMLSHFSPVRFFASLWIVAHQSPLSVGFSRQEYWSGLLHSPPGDLPDPEIKPTSLMSPALAGGFFTISTTWEAHKSTIFQYKIKSKLKIKKKNVGLEVLLKSEISLLSTFLPYPPRREFLPPFRGPLSPLTHCSQGRHTLL